MSFPSLSGTINVTVPNDLLESGVMEDESNHLLNSNKGVKGSRADIVSKFNELKENGTVKINRKLKYLSEEKIPIMTKDGDIRLECLDATLPKPDQVRIFIVIIRVYIPIQVLLDEDPGKSLSILLLENIRIKSHQLEAESKVFISNMALHNFCIHWNLFLI